MSNLYETDFYAWTQEQAELLKKQAWYLLDAANLIEEIESLGKQQRQELRNRLKVLIGHLLKWQYQPQRRGKSWRLTIREQRYEIERLLQDNPSLKPYLLEAIIVSYEGVRILAARETKLEYEDFPRICFYTTEDILSGFFPGDQEQ